jgi:hypothetical protein
LFAGDIPSWNPFFFRPWLVFLIKYFRPFEYLVQEKAVHLVLGYSEQPVGFFSVAGNFNAVKGS